MPKLKKLTAVLSFFLLIVVGWAFVPQEAAAQRLSGRGRVVQQAVVQQAVVQQTVVQQTRDQSAAPKIHMLFVWGTKATDTKEAVKISQKKITFGLWLSNLDDLSGSEHIEYSGEFDENSHPPAFLWYPRFLRTYIALEGDEASPSNIIEACRKLAQNAKPNDAVFVYMLCHGASIIEDGDTTETRIHALSPICKDANNMDLRTIGIRRSTILEAMKSTQHRLDMLVTDSCSALRIEPPKQKERDRDKDKGGSGVHSGFCPVPILISLLLSARGTININSSSPFDGNMKRGELALAWVPSSEYTNEYYRREFPYSPDSNYFYKASFVPYAGTVFTNAFEEVAGRDIDSYRLSERGIGQCVELDDRGNMVHIRSIGRNGREQVFRRDPPYSCEQFLSELRASLHETYKATEGQVHATNSGGLEVFMQQKTQTLTQFDDFGRALP